MHINRKKHRGLDVKFGRRPKSKKQSEMHCAPRNAKIRAGVGAADPGLSWG